VSAPLTRREFDALAQARAEALANAVQDYARQGMSEDGAQRAASEDAALILSGALSFADAVDRSGKGIPYEEAVMIEGGAGPVIVTREEWRATPDYFRTLAAGGHGRIDRIEEGASLLAYLRDGNAEA
jgi:hypothetical protein